MLSWYCKCNNAIEAEGENDFFEVMLSSTMFDFRSHMFDTSFNIISVILAVNHIARVVSLKTVV